jgi:DNA gyrase/topoisomerase IV subunit B
MNVNAIARPKFTEHVRAKPGMYFGSRGARGFAGALQDLIVGILKCAPSDYCGPLAVAVEGGRGKQTVVIHFEGWRGKTFSPETLNDWFELPPPLWASALVAGSDCFEMTSNARGKSARLLVRDGTDVSTRVGRTTNKSQVLEIKFEPHEPTFGRLDSDMIYWICGRLRDLSSLRAGLVTEVQAVESRISVRYEYAEGLRSRCSEETSDELLPWGGAYVDYFSVRAETGSERVDAFICSSWDGPSMIKSFVNFAPTSGGTHVQGLGRALRDLEKNFEKVPREFRTPKVEFKINLWKQAKLELSQRYRVFLHLQTPEPCYEGATKSVLAGTKFCQFVQKAAYPQLLEQWKGFEAKRKSG